MSEHTKTLPFRLLGASLLTLSMMTGGAAGALWAMNGENQTSWALMGCALVLSAAGAVNLVRSMGGRTREAGNAGH